MVHPPDTFDGSGGGLLGGIKALLQLDSVCGPALGDRIQPGRMNEGTPFPYVVMNHVNDTVDSYPWFTIPSGDSEHVDVELEYDTFEGTIQISTYHDSYEGCRLLSLQVHRTISRQVFSVDGFCTTIYPSTRTLTIDPKRSGQGRDIWHAVYRYTAQLSILVFPPGTQP